MRIRRNLAHWERTLSLVTGGLLVARAWQQRRDASLEANPQTVAGLSLIARGATGFCPVSAATGLGSRRDDTRSALGGSRGTRLKDSITIARPPKDVFEVWRNFEKLPSFMRGVERVERLRPGVTRWVFRAPGGMKLEWRAEIINEVAPSLIAWRSLPGADLVSAGSVHFTALPRGGTEVTVSMQYDPPGGSLGKAVNWMTGRAPASELREDLRRLKRWLETGEQPTVEGQPAGRRSRSFVAAEQVMS